MPIRMFFEHCIAFVVPACLALHGRVPGLPVEWKDFLSLYKSKGTKVEVTDLLSVPGKVFSHVLLERIYNSFYNIKMIQRSQ